MIIYVSRAKAGLDYTCAAHILVLRGLFTLCVCVCVGVDRLFRDATWGLCLLVRHTKSMCFIAFPDISWFLLQNLANFRADRSHPRHHVQLHVDRWG